MLEPCRGPLLGVACALFLLGGAAAPPAVGQADVPTADDWLRRGFWETVDGEPVSDGWRFEGGEVSLVDPGVGGSIVSPPLPAHFELSWSWRIEPGVNNGLKYRVRRFGTAPFESRYLGLEYQIIDSDPADTSTGSTAAIYDLVPPRREKTLRPPGAWNSSRVVAVGDRVEHYLNGDLVAAANLAGPAWDATVALSKFWSTDDFGRAREGDRIMLTDHGGRASFKDFRFVARAAPPSERVVPTGPFLGNASRNGWADQTSIVIWTRTTRESGMLVDGTPFVSISPEEARALADERDPRKLLDLQLPDGATLDGMFGACPGAPGRVRLSYFPEERRKLIRHTDWIETTAASDFTAQWRLEDLEPNSRYITIIEAQTPAGAAAAVARGAFRTAPGADEPASLRFCITTCHDFVRRDDGLRGHRIYPAMEALAPDFVVHAGDIEYYDKPDPWALTIDLMRFKWGRIFALPSNREFYARTTSYFIKDDHDTLANDTWPGQTYGAVTFEEGARLFNEEQFPARSPRYAHIRWGRDLEIWILEGRDFRSPNTDPDGPDKTILGAEQRAWLFRTLEGSTAAFKLVMSPTPIVGPDRPRKQDNHANDSFAWEGGQIREKLSTIPGVIVFCGDRHWQYASVDPETGLWEFGCGPGSERHELGWKEGDERPAHRFLRVAGGFLSGELDSGVDPDTAVRVAEPTLTIRHHTVTGAEQSRFLFPRDFAPRR